MDTTQGLEAEAAACDFVELWLDDRENGHVRSLAEYLARFPGFEARIAREYLALTEPVAAPDLALAKRTDERIGPYRNLRLLGQGGQGTVWLAVDTRLDRQVALKVLDTGGAAFSSTRISRLRREAQALARLEHPAICAIYEADLEAARPYLAMRYVEGDTLSTLLAEARDGRNASLPPRTKDALGPWLLFFAQVAEALHAAHELGIVHRDVKPGNLIRTREGAPVVLDFGLARDIESTSMSLTQSGELFGTLPYMAPELLAGRGPDRRIDVYALGVTLFEVLALRRPFEAATHEALRRQIESGEARPITEYVPGLAAELGIVLATAIERDPTRRYASAQAFADDLRRLERGDPIAARPIGLSVRLRRLVERHPVLAASVVILMLALGVALWLLAQVSRGREQLHALREAYRALSLSEDNPGRALDIASEAALREPHPEMNEILLRVLDRYWEERHLAYLPPTPSDRGDLSPWIETDREDRYLLFSAGDGSAHLFDLASGEVTRKFQHSAHAMVTAALVPGGKHVLSGGRDGNLRCWDLASGGLVWDRPAHTCSPFANRTPVRETVTRIVCSADGRRAVSCGDDGLVLVHDLVGNEPPVRCVGHRGAVARATFDPSGTRVLTVGDVNVNTSPGDLTVRIFDVATGRQLQCWGAFSGPVRWESWSRDGTRVALANDDSKARIFAVDSERELAVFPHQGQINWVEFAPDDRQLMTGSPDGFCVFDIASGRRVVRHADFHDRSVYRGALSPDGSRLAVVAWDDSGRIYDTKTWACQRTLRGITTRPRGLCWDHSGSRVITIGGALQVWYAKERPFLPEFKGHTDRVLSSQFSPDGQQVLTASADRTARVWESATGRCLRVLEHTTPLRGACYSPDARCIATCSEGAPCRVYPADGEPVLLGSAPARFVWFFGNDEVVAACDDDVVRLFSARTGKLEHEFTGHTGDIQCGLFHPTKPWLATGGNDRRICVWDLAARRELFVGSPWPPGLLGERERVFGLAFDARGERLAASCEDFALRIRELKPPYAERSLKVVPTVGQLAFLGTSNSLIYSAQWSGIVRVMDLDDPAATHVTPTQHSNMISRLVVRADGKLALTASRDGTVSLFGPLDGRLFSLIHVSDVAVTDAAFSPDGNSVLTATAEGAVRIWPVDPVVVAQRYRKHRADYYKAPR